MSSSPATMRAVRLSGPGSVDNLRLTALPLPPERDGWVRIRVEAFGLNRSELKLRLGLSVGVSFPRVPVAADRLAFPVDRVYDGLEQVPQAHDDMEHDRATGKLVVRVRH
jgi:NADPH:quinone reductase-like Zn-dependent oxidoreductase